MQDDNKLESEFRIYFSGLEAYLAGDHRRVRRILKNQDLEQCARRLLLARNLIRKRKFSLAQSVLDSLSPINSLFAAELNFVQASLLSFNSQWSLAFEKNRSAYALYKQINYRQGQFNAAYNASFCKNHLGESEQVLLWLSECESLAITARERCSVIRAMACEHSQQQNFKMAVQLMDQAFDEQEHLGDVDKIHLQVAAFDVFFRAGETEKCEALLSHLTKSKLNRFEARIQFESLLFRIAIGRIHSLPPRSEAIRANTEFNQMWNLLAAIFAGDLPEAEKQWRALHHLYPALYNLGFLNFPDSEKNSLLAKAIKKIQSTSQITMSCNALSGKLQSLYSLLATTSLPLRKEYLIERLWGAPYHPQYDERFYRLVRRLRCQIPEELVSEQRAYRLKSSPKIAITQTSG